MDVKYCPFAICPINIVCVSFIPTMSILMLLFLKTDLETAELFYLQVKVIIYHTCVLVL